MSNKKNLSAEETDLTRGKLLTSAGILAAGDMLSGAVKLMKNVPSRRNRRGINRLPAKSEKLPEGYNILLVVTDGAFFSTFPFPTLPGEATHENGGDIL